MTAKEITSVVNTYIKEYREYNISEEQLFREIYKLLFELKVNDIDTYYKFDNLSYVDQSKILQECLYEKINLKDDNPTNKILEESTIVTGITMAVTFILLFWFSRTEFQKRLTYKISKGIKNIANLLDFLSKQWSIRYKIIKNNSEKCYKECGVDINNISHSVYAGTQGVDSVTIRGANNYKDMKKGECMTECFLELLIESIKLLFLNYLYCLRQTGQYFKYENVSKDEIESLIGDLEITGPCENFRKELKNAIELYYDIIEYRFNNSRNNIENKKITEYRMKLADALLAARNSKEKPNKNINYASIN